MCMHLGAEISLLVFEWQVTNCWPKTMLPLWCILKLQVQLPLSQHLWHLNYNLALNGQQGNFET